MRAGAARLNPPSSHEHAPHEHEGSLIQQPDAAAEPGYSVPMRGAHFFDDRNAREDLGGKAVRGGFNFVLARLLNGVLQFGTTMVLARLLVPEDFGLVAIVAALSSFAPSLIDFGLTDATVQRPRVKPAEVSALFWLSLGVACSVALLLVAASPFLAAIYGLPTLAKITPVAATTFVFYGLAVQHLALLRRNMRFSDVAVIEITAYVIGAAVAIGMALLGSGVWALVARPIVSSIVIAAGAWIRCEWLPGRPEFNAEVKSMLKFGLNVTGFTLTNFVTRAADRAMLGFMVSPRMVGFYQNAILIYENAILAIVGPSANVGVSALSKLKEDPNLLREKYLTALSTISFYGTMGFATLSVVASDLVPFLLGETWAPAGPILAILALRGISHCVESSQSWLHLSLGHADRWMRFGLLAAVIHLVGVGAGLSFGVTGVAWGIVVSRSLITLPSVVYAGRPVGIGVLTVLQAVGRQLAGAGAVLLVGTVTLALLPEDIGRFGRLLIGSFVSVATYLILVAYMLRLKDPVRVGLTAIKRVRGGLS